MKLLDVFLNLCYSVFGAWLGVVIGVRYSKREFKRIRESEKQELRRKLIKGFQFNVLGLKQMHDQLTKARIVPDYRLDTESISHILLHGRDLFEDERWFDKFNWQRYQLFHINSKVEFLNQVLNSSSAPSDIVSIPGGVWQQRYSSLVGHLETSEKEILDLIAEYEKGA